MKPQKILKVSAFYLEKQKKNIPKKNLSFCQYQNKEALFTNPIFSEGFAFPKEAIFNFSTTNLGLCTQVPHRKKPAAEKLYNKS